MTAGAKKQGKQYLTERQRDEDLDSIVASPVNRQARGENTPLRQVNVSTTTPVKHQSNISNLSNIKLAYS